VFIPLSTLAKLALLRDPGDYRTEMAERFGASL
jgi:hypothetical protein